MTKEEFVAQLDRAVVVTPHLPVTSAILKHVAEQLKRGDPPWWHAVDHAWEKRQFHSWTEAWWLFITALHYEALSDAENPLVPFFPSCGGTDEADPSKAIAEFLKAAPRSFYDKLRTGQRRAFAEAWVTLPKDLFNEARDGHMESWSPLWFRPAKLFFQKRRLPYYLVEVNAGAGLNIAADLIMRDPQFDSRLVAARIGTDDDPLQLEDISHRRWLTAAVPPEQMPMIAVLDRLVDGILERQKKDAAFVQLAPCAAAAAPQFVAKNIPADPDVGLLLLTCGVTGQMGDAEYAKFTSAMMATMAPWADRALWVEFDKVREEMYSTTYQLRARRSLDGKPADAVISRFDTSLGQVRSQVMIKAEKFLVVA